MWWIHHGVVDKALEGREDAGEFRQALLGAGWVMIGVLLVNVQGFAKMNQIAWLVGPQGQGQGAWHELLISHLTVLAGTGSLMWLVTLALRDPAVAREPTPMLAASRAMVVTAEKLLPRFWWAALGLGALFGIAAGMGPVLLLAADLTLFWAAGRISLIVQRRKLPT